MATHVTHPDSLVAWRFSSGGTGAVGIFKGGHSMGAVTHFGLTKRMRNLQLLRHVFHTFHKVLQAIPQNSLADAERERETNSITIESSNVQVIIGKTVINIGETRGTGF